MYLSIKILDYITFLYYIALQSALQKDFSSLSSLILFRIGKKVPFPKICHTYRTMIKFGTIIPNEFYLNYESRDTLVDFGCHKNFLPEINKVCYVKKYRYRLHFIHKEDSKRKFKYNIYL